MPGVTKKREGGEAQKHKPACPPQPLPIYSACLSAAPSICNMKTMMKPSLLWQLWPLVRSHAASFACDVKVPGLDRSGPLLILSRWEPLAGNQRGRGGRRGVEERVCGHELFHLRRRAALTSAYKDANQNLEPLPRQVGRAAAGQVYRRKENTEWNFKKQRDTKQKFWHMLRG